MPFLKIVTAGSTGHLADHVLPALLNSTKPKFEVTVLTRPGSDKSKSLPGAKIIPVDYDDHPALVRAITGADAIVSLVASLPSKKVDLQLLAAAQEAGVRRIFPSEYTLDVMHPDGQALLAGGPDRWPDSISPVPVARRFAALASEGGPTSFTTIVPSALIDGWLSGEFSLFEPKSHKVTVVDGGEHYFTGASLPFTAACVLAALRMDEEKTKNKRIHVSEVRTTMKEIVGLYEEVTGAKFERINLSMQDLIAQREGLIKSGNPFYASFVSIQIGAYGGGGAGDLVDGLQFNADGHLTVARKDIKQLVAEAVKKIETA